MGHFCIGSFTRALLSGAQKGETQATFCPRLFAMLDPHVKNSITFEDTMGQILGGAQNLNTEWIRIARDMNPLKAERYFYQFVTPFLEPQKHSQLLLVLKEIIDADPMKEDIQLGKIASMTKHQFLEMSHVPFTQVLTDLFLYAVEHTENTDQKAYIKKITKKYCDRYDDRKDEITTYEVEAVKPLESIGSSLRGKGFDRTFHKVYESTIGLKKPNHVRIYRLGLNEVRFVYEQLHDFVENSIGYYVLSRAQVKEMIAEEEEARIYPKAKNFLREQYKNNPDYVCETLPGLMVYSFLEKSLKAPKLLNSMELQRPGFLSNSVHLLKLEGVDEPVFQVVYATSHIVGGLKEAISNGLDQVARIDKNSNKEHQLIDSSSLRMACTDEEAKAIRAMIFPNKINVDFPKDAYGIFLGYTTNLPDSSSMESEAEFAAAVEEKLKEDIEANISFINDKIKDLGLMSHSFYFYILPFNDVEDDLKNLFEHIIGTEGVST